MLPGLRGRARRAQCGRGHTSELIKGIDMNRSNAIRHLGSAALLMTGLALAYPQSVRADEPPQIDKDGLQLKEKTKTRILYVRPGASLAQYKRVHILDCHVEFQKDWQDNFNRSVRDLSGRITQSDIEYIKDGLAEEFRKEFTKELQKGGYQIADEGGPDVLILRPALLNVVVTAPDIMRAGRSAMVVDSAGSMTLYMELWDSATNTILARVMDAQADPRTFSQSANRVTNVSAARRILGIWAKDLREHLDAARGQAPSG
jgi:Protein of unknown function (DUF3313)